jgi:hypothetical protein
MFDLVSLRNKALVIILYLLLSDNENCDKVFYSVSLEIGLRKDTEKGSIK